ncbi:MAG: competence protein ComK [Bacilli bacterium]|nr:competence protein ComK [Bacilli bacterium]
MKELNNYIINLETLLLIPVDDKKTKVFEVDEEFIVKKSMMDIIKDSCLFFGSSFEGRKEGTKSLLKCGIKVPIIIDDSRDLILFPTLSYRNERNIWVVYNNLVDYSKYDLNNTLFLFRNNNDIKVNVKFNIVDNQVFRCLKLDAIMKKRKELE